MDSVKVFISWAGESSRQVGEALRAWLPNVLDRVDPWISARDLDKGGEWQRDVMDNLRNCQFGIVSLTSSNLGRPWMLFEAGAISALTQGRVFTFLHRVKYAEVTGPLAMFNHTEDNKTDVRKMIADLNKALAGPKNSRKYA